MEGERRDIVKAAILIVSMLVFGGVFAVGRYASDIRNYLNVQATERQTLTERISYLETEVETLRSRLNEVSGQSASTAETLEEVRQAQSVRQKTPNEILTEVVAKASPSVVSIVVSKEVPQLEVVYQNPFGNDPNFRDVNIRIPVYRQRGVVEERVGAGTGFIVSAQGHIVTNRHVVEDRNAQYTVLLSDGKQTRAQVVHRDSENDIAILKIEGSYIPLVLGNSDTLRLGESVVAIGNALGEYNNSVSMGIVSGLNRDIRARDERGGYEELKGVIQTDAAINRGNSGGPLLNTRGEVIGVNVATVVGSNSIGFALPSNDVRGIVRTVLSQ